MHVFCWAIETKFVLGVKEFPIQYPIVKELNHFPMPTRVFKVPEPLSLNGSNYRVCGKATIRFIHRDNDFFFHKN